MNRVQIFQDKKVRTHWDAEREEWYFSVVDVVAVLTDSVNPTDYLKKMRKRDPELATFLGTNCPQVDMLTETGKRRKTLAADSKAVFRIIQSIPSPKAEPFKQWLAQVGTERMDETIAESRNIAIEGGNVAGSARREIEQRTGQPVVSPLNASDKLALDTNIDEVKQIESNDRAGRSGK